MVDGGCCRRALVAMESSLSALGVLNSIPPSSSLRSAYLVLVLGVCLLIYFAINVHVECIHLFGWPSHILTLHLVRTAGLGGGERGESLTFCFACLLSFDPLTTPPRRDGAFATR